MVIRLYVDGYASSRPRVGLQYVDNEGLKLCCRRRERRGGEEGSKRRRGSGSRAIKQEEGEARLLNGFDRYQYHTTPDQELSLSFFAFHRQRVVATSKDKATNTNVE